MKTLSTVLATITLTVTPLTMVNATELTPINLEPSTQLCMAAASSSRVKMLNSLKELGYSRSFVFDNVKCNDLHITEFVAKYGKAPDKMNAMLSYGQRSGHVSINDIASL